MRGRWRRDLSDRNPAGRGRPGSDRGVHNGGADYDGPTHDDDGPYYRRAVNER